MFIDKAILIDKAQNPIDTTARDLLMQDLNKRWFDFSEPIDYRL